MSYSIYLDEIDPQVVGVAKALFKRAQDRAGVAIIKPQPGDPVLSEWKDLSVAVVANYHLDAKAAILAFHKSAPVAVAPSAAKVISPDILMTKR